MDNKTFFTILIESVGPEQSFIQVFWVWSKHPGEGIEKVLRACARMGIQNALASEADVYDFDSLRDHIVFDEKLDVYLDETRHYFPTGNTFAPPFGILKSCRDSELDYDLIREGFSRSKCEDGIYEVEAVIGKDKLFNTFIELVKRLSSIKVFWLKIASDWEEKGREEFWTNDYLNTPERITDYLTIHANDTILNGHVALTAYCGVGQTNLLVDTHKVIKILTKSAKMQSKMVTGLKRLGFEETSELHSLEYGYYHWHFRPSRSKSRARLVAALKRDGFKAWHPNEQLSIDS